MQTIHTKNKSNKIMKTSNKTDKGEKVKKCNSQLGLLLNMLLHTGNLHWCVVHNEKKK